MGLGASNVCHLGSWPKYGLYVYMSPQSSVRGAWSRMLDYRSSAVSVAGEENSSRVFAKDYVSSPEISMEVPRKMGVVSTCALRSGKKCYTFSFLATRFMSGFHVAIICGAWKTT